MNEEPVFTDRLIPVLALPGALLSVVLLALDWLNGSVSTSWGLWLLITAMLSLFSVIILTIPLYVIAKFQILRSKGFARTKVVGVMVLGLCALIVLGFVQQGAGKLLEWLFVGSRFYLLAGSALVLFLLIYWPYSLYRERKERSKLKVIENTPSRRSEIVQK